MRIGFVVDDTLDKPDGVQQYVLTLGGWLKSQGHEVHYLSGQSRRSDIPHLYSLSRNIRVRFNGNRLSIPLPANQQRIRELLARQKYDVLHIQMPYSPFLAGRIIKLAPPDTAIVGTFHILPYGLRHKLATRLLGLWLRRSLKRFTTVLAVSPPAAKFARRAFGVKAVVVPNMINLRQFTQAKRLRKYDDGKTNIIFLGRLVERKGIREFLNAIQQLHTKNLLMNVRVIIGGRGPLLKELRAYVKKHRLGTVVHFAGFVAESDKPDFLASAHIAVFPSVAGESFGIVLLEAMAAGAETILAGRNPGYLSVMENKDQLIRPLNTKAFAKTLKHYVVSSPARRRSKKWQAAAVHKYDVNVVGKTILGIYVQALQDIKEVR